MKRFFALLFILVGGSLVLNTQGAQLQAYDPIPMSDDHTFSVENLFYTGTWGDISFTGTAYDGTLPVISIGMWNGRQPIQMSGTYEISPSGYHDCRHLQSGFLNRPLYANVANVVFDCEESSSSDRVYFLLQVYKGAIQKSLTFSPKSSSEVLSEDPVVVAYLDDNVILGFNFVDNSSQIVTISGDLKILSQTTLQGFKTVAISGYFYYNEFVVGGTTPEGQSTFLSFVENKVFSEYATSGKASLISMGVGNTQLYACLQVENGHFQTLLMNRTKLQLISASAVELPEDEQPVCLGSGTQEVFTLNGTGLSGWVFNGSGQLVSSFESKDEDKLANFHNINSTAIYGSFLLLSVGYDGSSEEYVFAATDLTATGPEFRDASASFTLSSLPQGGNSTVKSSTSAQVTNLTIGVAPKDTVKPFGPQPDPDEDVAQDLGFLPENVA
mmetsp:Transcript_2624/g.2745  ORF Transcript_2624/g.2745 Transcript_2624/m.2745 type:complete len:442 (-) Transcript_2624:174-1499(-)